MKWSRHVWLATNTPHYPVSQKRRCLKSQTRFDRDNDAAHHWVHMRMDRCLKKYVVRMGDGKGNMQAECCHGSGQRGELTQYLHQSEV